MAENTPNKPDDKKDAPANETQKKENAAPVTEPVKADGKAPDNKEPEKAAAQTGKPVQDKKEAPATEKKAEDKDDPAKADEAANDEKLKREQEAALKALDEKAAFYEKNKTPKVIKFDPKKAAPGKEKPSAKEKPPAKDEKEQEPDGLPTLAERKAKLEQELREKYGIPKSGKTVEPYVIPEVEQVVRIPHEKLKPFKDHPFNVDKTTMKFIAFVASIRAQGVTQPAVVRPSGKDEFEIISGHRRDAGSIAAEIPYTPCIVRALNDDQAIQQMVEDNINHRDISDMELARALQKQLDSIKRQGARETLAEKDLSLEADENIGKRSNQIIAERNGMSVKQVQRYIALNNLTPALQEYVDGKPTADGKKVMQLKFTPAFELSYLKPENQDYVAVSIEGQQSMPSLSQVQRMRELDKNNQLKPDIIDGILMEQKKEVDKVILSQAELAQYFGRDKTPRDMKDKIIELLEQYKAQQKDIAAPEKKDKQDRA